MIQGVEMMIGVGVAPEVAGSKMVEGTLSTLTLLFVDHGVVPEAQVMLVGGVEPGIPRASMTRAE
jgi:hypothetical protein